MSYEPLHHKYRPQTFNDLVGQDAIAQTLTNAITSEKIAPAYLFTGPRGTGKTSSARIFSKSLNCLSSDKPTPYPCGKCDVCRAIARGSALDVIEIDAASNTGVDNIRELIEKAQFAPVQCRYKVYVVDECHMLSVSASNALLKTLEEPPDRVIFVLATTDPQRVLATIISRCQRFDYRRIPLEDMANHLKKIATLENIDIDDEAITLVAQIANGGLRDAESLLDQLGLLSGTVTSERVWELVGAIPEKDLLKLIKLIRDKNPEKILEQCRKLMNRGKEPLIVLQNLAGFYLNLLIAKTAPNRADMVAITAPTWNSLCEEAQHWELNLILQGQQHLKDSEVQIKNTTQPRLWLEVTLLGLLSVTLPPPPTIEPQQPVTQKAPSYRAETSPQTKPTPEPIQPTPPPVQEYSAPTPVQPVSTPPTTEEPTESEHFWSSVLQHIQLLGPKQFFSQQANLISFNGSVARVGIKSENLMKMAKGKISVLEDAFQAVCKHPVKVNLELATPSKSSPTELNGSGSHTPSVPQIDNNGYRTPVQPPPQPDTEKPPVLSKDTGVKTPDIPPINSPNKGKTGYSEDELERATRIFLQAFDGEIIVNDDLEALEPETGRNTPKFAGETLPRPIPGRPQVDPDDDDLDF